MMEAIILAGGFGTRLRSVVTDVPKPMADVAGKPFLEILLCMLKAKGFQRIIISVGYMSDKIIGYFGKKFGGIDLIYEIETEPLGTGGAIKKAFSHLKGDHVYIFNGDTYLDVDILAVESLWDKTRDSVLVARQVKNTKRYGRIIVKNGLLIDFIEKDSFSSSGLINGGVYLLSRDVFDSFSCQDKFSFEKDFFPSLIKKKKVHVFVSNGQFIDIGTPDDYFKAKSYLSHLVQFARDKK